ncbi:MAG TPA: hypothetical protein PKI14_04375 [Fervidobacterium sp.]|nr:hypothetical protein [Fervidobacterium sp.]
MKYQKFTVTNSVEGKHQESFVCYVREKHIEDFLKLDPLTENYRQMALADYIVDMNGALIKSALHAESIIDELLGMAYNL